MGDPLTEIPQLNAGENPAPKIFVGLFPAFGEIPDDQTEADLIDGVADVIDDVHIGGQFGGVAEHVARQGHIPDRVDGPSDEDKAAQEIERNADIGIAAAVGQLFGFAEEDFIDDSSPTDGGDNTPAEVFEATDGLPHFGGNFTDVTGDEHQHRVADEAPEHIHAGTRRFEEEVELHAHERHGEEPIDVAEFGGRGGTGVITGEGRCPILSHIHVVGGRDRGDQSTDQQRGLPFIRDGLPLEVKEDRGGKHCHGPDKEGEPDKVTRFHCCSC